MIRYAAQKRWKRRLSTSLHARKRHIPGNF